MTAGLNLTRIDFISVLDQLDDGVIIADTNGVVVFYNRAQGKIDNLSPAKAIGRKVTEIYDLSNQSSMIMKCIVQGAAIKSKAFFYRTFSGHVANTITSVYPLIDQDGINGVICFVKDYEQLQKTHPMPLPRENRPDLGNGTQYTFTDLIGGGTEFMRVLATARKAAASASPIMIQGETGTGKELFAQAIHNHSERRKFKFVAVNCGAIPRDLLEGLLFGTTKGAFTGAVDKPGLIESAHKGTLFLDELLSMPMDLQAKLLRVLQERQVQRLGSDRQIPVEMKVISSVCEDPRTAIRNNLLRTDLFYRLGVVMIKLPPLRKRVESLGDLVSHFIRKINDRMGTRVTHISNEVFERFLAYQWPGNIRELEHLIEGAMNMVSYEEIMDLKHFMPGMDQMEQVDLSNPNAGAIPTFSFPPTAMSAMGLAQSQKSREEQAIRSALAKVGGNVTQAAAALGISRQLLHYKMRKFKFTRQQFMTAMDPGNIDIKNPDPVLPSC